MCFAPVGSMIAVGPDQPSHYYHSRYLSRRSAWCRRSLVASLVSPSPASSLDPFPGSALSVGLAALLPDLQLLPSDVATPQLAAHLHTPQTQSTSPHSSSFLSTALYVFARTPRQSINNTTDQSLTRIALSIKPIDACPTYCSEPLCSRN